MRGTRKQQTAGLALVLAALVPAWFWKRNHDINRIPFDHPGVDVLYQDEVKPKLCTEMFVLIGASFLVLGSKGGRRTKTKPRRLSEQSHNVNKNDYSG